MAEEYIKAQDISGFEKFPEQLQKLLSVPSEHYDSKGFLFDKDSSVYYSSYTTREYKAKYMFYSEKCLVTLETSLAPKSIDIDFFKCFGHEKGSGRKLLCYALTWIKQELGLPSQTSVFLEADATYSNTVEKAVSNAREAENENEAQRLEDTAMESLKAYYRKYGFQGQGSSMEAKLDTVVRRCQSGGGCDEFFEERKEWILEQLQAYHSFLHSSKPKKSSTRKLSGSKKKSSTRKLSAPKALSAKGGTRRK